METEIEVLRSPHSLRPVSRFSSIGRDPEINENLQYTSLKDIILYNTPSTLYYEGNDFDSSNITIRNELVKRAASVYLQSAALLVTRNQNCFEAFWEKLKSKAVSCSCWRVFVENPIRACLWPIFWVLNHRARSVCSGHVHCPACL